MTKPGTLEPRPRDEQHVERQIDPEPALDLRPEQFEHAAGAGAEIEQRTERPLGQRRADRVLDRRIGDVQAPDAIPFGGVRPEIFLRGCGARGAHSDQPLAVARDHRIGRIEPPDQRVRQFGGGAVLAEPKERPAAFAIALDQPGFGQELEVARYPWLRLPQDFGQVGDGQLSGRADGRAGDRGSPDRAPMRPFNNRAGRSCRSSPSACGA